jgi:hypothetical protein
MESLWAAYRWDTWGGHGRTAGRGVAGISLGPDSNYFLYNKTAPVDRLKKRLPILFGTDSTLSAGWNGWEQLRLARAQGMLTDEELLDGLTGRAAAVWNFPMLGKLAVGYQADLVITKGRDVDSLFANNPEDLLLVMHRGKIRLFDSSLADQLAAAGHNLAAYSPVLLGTNTKFVQGDLPGLLREIVRFDPEAELPVSAVTLKETTCQ